MAQKNLIFFIPIMVSVMLGMAHAQTAPDSVTIAGGYTATPFLIKAGEKFVSKFPQFKPPKALVNSTAIGFKLFCSGVGIETPNINTATRRIRPGEWELCNKNGVTEIIEFEIGRDAIILAQASGGRLAGLSSKDFVLAVAKDVPDPKDAGKRIPNPYKSWKEINPSLPDSKIQVLAPDATIGLYDTYINGLVLPGCRQVEPIADLEVSDPKAFEAACKSFRKDGLYIEFNDMNAEIQSVKNNLDSVGVLALTMALRNQYRTLSLDNMEPSIVAVSRRIYTLTFSLLVYVKKAHVNEIPGFKEYLTELTSNEAVGILGYFFEMGAIPLPLVEQDRIRADVQALKVISKS